MTFRITQGEHTFFTMVPAPLEHTHGKTDLTTADVKFAPAGYTPAWSEDGSLTLISENDTISVTSENIDSLARSARQQIDTLDDEGWTVHRQTGEAQ